MHFTAAVLPYRGEGGAREEGTREGHSMGKREGRWRLRWAQAAVAEGWQ